VVETKTGRNYFLDYPCDLKKGEKVTLVLSLHGAGAPGNWQRHYFPIFDYKDQNRLVIATPFSPTRVWAATDDEYLQNIVTSVIDQVGRNNIKAFWLVGHSQGGATSNRLVCTDFFKNKVDGFLSLSGGRVGGSPQRGGNFGNLAPRGGATGEGRGGAPRGGGAAAPALPSCDFSHIYETGEHEMQNDLAVFRRTPHGPRSTAAASSRSALRSWIQTPATSTTERVKTRAARVGDFFHVLEQRKSSFIPSARTAESSQMSCVWTKDTPKVSSQRSRRKL